MIFENPYALRTESCEGIARYYISFRDGQDVHHETEVSRPVYREFERFAKVERNLIRWDERHTEQSELWEETLNERTFNPPQSLEETVFDMLRNKRLRQAIAELPEVQRRRFVLHHEFGLTYEQIATMEGWAEEGAFSRFAPQLRQFVACERRVHEADSGMARAQRFQHDGKHLHAPCL